jgi:hypothetical protein
MRGPPLQSIPLLKAYRSGASFIPADGPQGLEFENTPKKSRLPFAF